MLTLTLANSVVLGMSKARHVMFQSSTTPKHGPNQATVKKTKKTNQLTERHLASFAQLAVLTPLHLLVREDFLQRPRQKHALRFTVFCL